MNVRLTIPAQAPARDYSEKSVYARKTTRRNVSRRRVAREREKRERGESHDEEEEWILGPSTLLLSHRGLTIRASGIILRPVHKWATGHRRDERAGRRMEEGSQEFRRPSRTSDLWGKKQIKVQQGARHNENSMGLRRAQGSIVIRARRCKPIFSLPRSTIGAGLWLAGWAGLGWLALRCVA